MIKIKMYNRIVLTLVIILVIGSGFKSDPYQKLRVLSYNVWVGFQQDSLVLSRYINWVNRMDPDIVAYQEMNNFSQTDLEVLAEKYSHPYAIQSKEDGFPVALTSKFPIVNVQKVVDNMHHAYLYGVTNNIHVFVIHFSPHRYLKRQHEVEIILAHAALLNEDDMIMIVGDFNALSASDSVNYSKEFIEGIRKTDESIQHRQNLKNNKLDFSVISRVEAAGFKDVFKLHNDEFKISKPTATRVAQRGAPIGGGERIDFAFVNSALAQHIISADIIHDEDTDQISDHYPVYFEIRF